MKLLFSLACLAFLSACVPVGKYKTLLSEREQMAAELKKAKEQAAVDTITLPCNLEKEKAALLLQQKEMEKRTEMIVQSASQKVLAAEQRVKELEEEVKKLKGN